MTVTIRPLHVAIVGAVLVALAVVGVILASSGGDEPQDDLAAIVSPTLEATLATATATATTTRPSVTLLGTSTPRASATAAATSAPPTATSVPSPAATSTPAPTATPTGVQDAANRVFVDPARGSDSNNGRRATPFKTLERALDAAESLTEPEVYFGGGQLLSAEYSASYSTSERSGSTAATTPRLGSVTRRRFRCCGRMRPTR